MRVTKHVTFINAFCYSRHFVYACNKTIMSFTKPRINSSAINPFRKPLNSLPSNEILKGQQQMHKPCDNSLSSNLVDLTKDELTKPIGTKRKIDESNAYSGADIENVPSLKKKVIVNLSSDDGAISWSSSPPRMVTKTRTLPWKTKTVNHINQASRNYSNDFSDLDAILQDIKPTLSPQKKINKAGLSVVQQLILSPEQQRVLQMVTQEGKNVFFTGSAGTGKSVLLREIIKTFRARFGNNNDVVAVTASTGNAACNIGGITLHSFSGIGVGKDDVEQLYKKISKNRKALSRWQRTKVLIIDEISMIDAELFDKLECIGRKIRFANKKTNCQPFGGIQIVVTGDFFQLPPVTAGRMPKFCFEAQSWAQCIHHTVCLEQVFRQKDETFVNILNEMRLGKIASQKALGHLRSLSRSVEYTDGIEPTELFPTRQEVDRANRARLDRINEPSMIFEAHDSGTSDPMFRDRLLDNCMAPRRLELKKGAQVMLIRNIDQNLVNGSLGRIVDFVEDIPTDEWEDGESQNDEKGSRIMRNSTKTSATSSSSKNQKPKELWPLVEFIYRGQPFTRILTRKDGIWKIELPNGEVQAERAQVPLILSWALSIHKSQGQTLERVKVDLNKIFEKGQAYVALSRATSMEGLQVLNFSSSKVMAHPKVIEWSKTLERLR